MPTLFPPLEAEGDGESVLPADVKANFEAIQSIIRAQRRLAKEQKPPLAVGTSTDAGNEPEKRPNEKEDGTGASEDVGLVGEGKNNGLENRKRKLAVATAVAVQSEISRLTNGIAELEALLLEEGNDVDPSEIEFPVLPSVVPDEEADDVEGAKDECDEVGKSDTTKEEMDVLNHRKK